MSLPKPKAAMRGFLATILVGAFMTGLFWTINYQIPARNEALVNYMLGALNAMAMMAVGYYFGVSQTATDQQDAWQADPRFPPTPADRPPPLPKGRDLPQPSFGIDDPDQHKET